MKKKNSLLKSSKFKIFSAILAIILITSSLVSASDINKKSKNNISETILGYSQLDETVLGDSQPAENEDTIYGISGIEEEILDDEIKFSSMALASPASYPDPVYGFDVGPHRLKGQKTSGQFIFQSIYTHISYGIIPEGEATDTNRPVPVKTDKEMLWLDQVDRLYIRHTGSSPALNGSSGAYFWYHENPRDATYVVNPHSGAHEPLVHTGQGRNTIGQTFQANSSLTPAVYINFSQMIREATENMEGGAKAGLYTALVYRTSERSATLEGARNSDYCYVLVWWDPAGISTIKATIDLDGGFVRGPENTYYNPTTVKPSYNLTTEGGTAPEVTQHLQLVKENAQGIEEVMHDFGTSTNKNWTITSLEKYFDGTINSFPPGDYTFVNTASYEDSWNNIESHEVRTNFTWFDDSPKILVTNAFNPTETDVTFDTVFADSAVEWRIYSSTGTTPIKRGYTRNIPTINFATLNSDTKVRTSYRIELTEEYAQGYGVEADSKTIEVRRPNPGLVVNEKVNPTSIDLQLDSEISNSSYNWKISGPEEISGENRAITTDELTNLEAGEYTIELWQTYTPYVNGHEKGAGKASDTFSIVTDTIIDAPKNIVFGSHNISANMVIPWESIDNKTAAGSVNGEVLAATIKIGSENVTGIKLTASPMTTDVSDPNASVPGTLYWATFDKQQNVLEKTSLESVGHYVVDQNSNIAPGKEFEVTAKDNSQVTEGFYFVTDSTQLSKLKADDYSAVLTWHVEIVP